MASYVLNTASSDRLRVVYPPSRDYQYQRQEAQLVLTTCATRLGVSRGQQTWYHFGSVATFR